MAFPYFSRNGEVLPAEQAVVPLSRVEYAYGFGVYETIRVSKGHAFFVSEHCQRLMESARVIGLKHNFLPEFVAQSVAELLRHNAAAACNVKILLIGGSAANDATLDIVCLNRLFPDRQLYKSGAAGITYHYEREFPAAKTLNMLSSYLAFRQAKAAGAYDALLVNRNGCITEGTRTNFFGLQGRTLLSPPSDQILPGITRAKVIEVALQNSFEVKEQAIPLAEIAAFDSAFLTSTSAKILPLSKLDETYFSISPTLVEMMRGFDAYLAEIRATSEVA